MNCRVYQADKADADMEVTRVYIVNSARRSSMRKIAKVSKEMSMAQKRGEEKKSL